METIDLGEEDGATESAHSEDTEGLSPMETVTETPVEEPDDDSAEADKASGEDDAAKAEAEPRRADDDSIESVADDDTPDDIRPPRKPRPRKYKIQEVIKVRQILLVQVVKEERGNKGAALTTYLQPCGPLLRADAQHRARRRHLPQDHQRRGPQQAQGDRGPRSTCRRAQA